MCARRRAARAWDLRPAPAGLRPERAHGERRPRVPAAERRKELAKTASKLGEDGKVAIRNIRRDAIDKIKKQEKDGEFSEDQSRDEQDAIQKTLDKFIALLEKHLADKEADILKV